MAMRSCKPLAQQVHTTEILSHCTRHRGRSLLQPNVLLSLSHPTLSHPEPMLLHASIADMADNC